jgi:hypothetical protein
LWSWLVASGRACVPSHHDDEAGFLALEEFLDHHAGAGIAHPVVGEHHVDGGVRFGQVHGHHHALAGGQAVGLDDDGRALRVDVGVRLGGVGEGLEGGGRDLVALHEALGEILGGFELGRLARRPEDLQAAARKASTTPAASGASGPTTVR